MIRFGEELGVSSDLSITAPSDTVALKFDWPRRWRPQSGSRLCLVIEHTPELDDVRSFLSVSLNYGVLRSVRLDLSNASSNEITVELPPGLIKADNEIRLYVEQSSKSGAGEVWTRISRRSFVEIPYQATPEPAELGALPQSLFGPNHYVPAQLAVLAPHEASSESLEATSLLVAWLTLQARPRRVQVRVVNALVAAGEDALLIVGTPAEHPELEKLPSKPPALLSPQEGVVFLSDLDNGAGRTLVVTGNSAEAALRAARYVSTGGRLRGAIARVMESRSVQVEPRVWRNALPLQYGFLLSALETEDIPLSAASTSPAFIELNPTPDAEFLPFGHKASLKLRLNPEQYRPQNVVTVELNGTEVARHAVERIAKGLSANLSFAIPAGLLGRVNRLKIQWRPGDGVDRHAVAAWVSRESSFYLPRIYSAKIPDLALLRHRLFPFSLLPDFSDVVVAVPDPLARPLLPALVELAAAIGRAAPGSGVSFQVRKISEITEGLAKRSHMLVLHVDGTENPLAETQAKAKPMPRRRGFQGAPAIRESLSPWNAEKCILTISGSFVQGVEKAVRELLAPPLIDELELDAAYVAGNAVECYRLEKQRDLRHSSLKARLDAWLLTNWLALPIVLTVASALLYAALRLLLRHRRQGEQPAQRADGRLTTAGPR